MIRRSICTAVAVGAGALLLASCSSGPSSKQSGAGTSTTKPTTSTTVAGGTTTPSTSTTSSAPPGQAPATLHAAMGNTQPYWLFENYSVQALLSSGLSQSLLQKFFNNPQTFIIVKQGMQLRNPLLPDATYAMSFANFTVMQNAFAKGSVPANVSYILFDEENWAATPANEQQQPFTYEAQAEALAHQHGKGFIFTPAANLAGVLNSGYSAKSKYTGYVSLGIASQGAKYADVFEIQAQQEEGLVGFHTFVSSAVSQAEAANPHAVVLAGLTTAAPGQAVTTQTLMNAYTSVRSEVSGYWLNIPGGTAAGPENPQVAVSFLEALAPQLGY
jgi:hypothetical protein